MNRFARIAVVLLAAVWVSGCSWLRGEDNATPPTELNDIQAPAKLDKVWERDVGAGIDDQFLRIRPAVAGVPFRRFVVGLFGFRRKQLVRGLRELMGAPAAVVAGWLGQAEIDETARPETLEPARFVSLFRAAQRHPPAE